MYLVPYSVPSILDVYVNKRYIYNAERREEEGADERELTVAELVSLPAALGGGRWPEAERALS